jgi:hypothetical protein
MRRWGDGQGKHLTGTERDEIHRRIAAAETFDKIVAAVGCSTKSIQRLLHVKPASKRKSRVRSPRRLSQEEREELSRGLMLGHSFRRVAEGLGRAPSTISREVNVNGKREAYRVLRAEETSGQRNCRPPENWSRTLHSAGTARKLVSWDLLLWWTGNRAAFPSPRERRDFKVAHPGIGPPRATHHELRRQLPPAAGADHRRGDGDEWP